MFNNLNFFVTLKSRDEELKIYRVNMNQQTQQLLTASFSDGANKILDTELERVEFDGSYKPEKGEINIIKEFELDDDIISAIKEPTSVENLEAEENIILKIKSVFCGEINEDKSIVCFSNFTKSNYLTKKGITNIFHNGNTFTNVPGPGFNISGNVDVIFKDGKLIFWKYWTARQILNLTAYYREATNEDLEDFINHDVINVAEKDSFMEVSDSWVRRKVASLKDSKAFDYSEPSLIAEKAEKYGVEISVKKEDDGEQINLPSEKKELKKVLRFLDEDYYSGPLTSVKYVTNSKRKV